MSIEAPLDITDYTHTNSIIVCRNNKYLNVLTDIAFIFHVKRLSTWIQLHTTNTQWKCVFFICWIKNVTLPHLTEFEKGRKLNNYIRLQVCNLQKALKNGKPSYILENHLYIISIYINTFIRFLVVSKYLLHYSLWTVMSQPSCTSHSAYSPVAKCWPCRCNFTGPNSR